MKRQLMTRLPHRRAAVRALIVAAAVAVLPLAHGQSGPITFMVPQAAGGTGDSLSHLLSAWFKAEAKLDAVHVPYTSTAPALAGLLGGQVDFYFDPVTTAVPQVRGGKARALATSAAQRSSQLSDVPTLMELGYP